MGPRRKIMDRSLLVKVIGFPATLIHGDPLVFDRWMWLKKRLPETKNSEKLIDIGCGTGAFSIGAALRGYEVLGLSWDERNQKVAAERAKICKAHKARFEVLNVTALGNRNDLINKFDMAICFETIEHIINDQRLIIDITACLKPGGCLLLTTPYLLNRPITTGDKGPFSKIEDGGHVRRGYTTEMIEELCKEANLISEQISYCSGFLSQKITFLLRIFSVINPLFGWGITLPFRIAPPLFDRLLTNILRWPYFSICLVAHKPSGSPPKTRPLES